jgi:hypothetical protein
VTDPIKVKILPDDHGQIIGRHLIELGCAVGTAAIFVWVQRKLSGPDVFLTVKMRSLHALAMYADSRATFWRDISARASELYLESRP